MDLNVFFVSTQGQVRNVAAYIKQFNVENVIIVVLYTLKNTASLKHILNLIEELKADGLNILEVKQYCLPNRPTAYSRKNMKKIYEGYEKVFYEIECIGNIKNVFICNFNNHYIYIPRIISKKDINLKLLEEGLGTYTSFLTDRQHKMEKIDRYKLIDSISGIEKEFRLIFKAIKSIFRKIFIFLVRLISIITRVNIESIIKDKLISEKYKFGWIKEFNEVCVCFPETLKKSDIKSNNFIKLDLKSSMVIDQKELDIIPPNSNIFINQKYGLDNKEHFKVVLDILEEMKIKDIFFKFHPKENIELNKEILNELLIDYKINVMYFENIEHLPVENIIQSKNMSKIIGINSSAMVYAPMFNEDIEIISIAKKYISKAIEEYNIPTNKLEILKRDYEEIAQIFEMKQIS